MKSPKGLTILAAASAGAMLAYLLDPTQGKRRRALVRDKAVSQMKSIQDAAPGLTRNLRNRARGIVAVLGSRFSHAEVSDEVLAERVRSRLGRETGHIGSVDVTVAGGEVILSGLALENEIGGLKQAVQDVPGVRNVICRVQARSEAGNIPGLQR
jgi:osmotically-inducible protein OsmY